jgi:hypothetical protein
MIKGQIIQPLVIDLKAFRKRFASLVNLSTYERANKLALENKRAKWAAYRPLEKAQLYDSLDEINTTILSPNANYSSKRSSKGGVMYAQATVVHRPTELLAIAHALGLYTFASDDPVVRQDPNRIVWWCISCKTFKPLADFAKDKDNIHGLSFACKHCQKDSDHRIWRKAA